MSRYYISYEEEDAYRNGRRDGNYGRFDHTYDCRWGDDVDKAYCEGFHEVEEERAEERRREEEEMERQMMREEEMRRQMRWEQEEEMERQRQWEEETERDCYMELARQYEEYIDQVPPDQPPPEEEDPFNNYITF